MCTLITRGQWLVAKILCMDEKMGSYGTFPGDGTSGHIAYTIHEHTNWIIDANDLGSMAIYGRASEKAYIRKV